MRDGSAESAATQRALARVSSQGMGYRDATTATHEHRAALEIQIAETLATIEQLVVDYDAQTEPERERRDAVIIGHRLAIEAIEAELAELPPADD